MQQNSPILSVEFNEVLQLHQQLELGHFYDSPLTPFSVSSSPSVPSSLLSYPSRFPASEISCKRTQEALSLHLPGILG